MMEVYIIGERKTDPRISVLSWVQGGLGDNLINKLIKLIISEFVGGQTFSVSIIH